MNPLIKTLSSCLLVSVSTVCSALTTEEEKQQVFAQAEKYASVIACGTSFKYQNTDKQKHVYRLTTDTN